MAILGLNPPDIKRAPSKTNCISFTNNITRLPWTRKRSLAVDLLIDLRDQVDRLKREGRL